MNQKPYLKRKTIFPHRDSKKFYSYWWSKKAFFGSLLERIRDKKDAMILVTGDTGVGKSHCTGTFCFKHGEKTDNFITNDGTKMFIAKENFIIEPEEFAYKMVTKSGQILWGDEFRNAANRRNWFSPINKAIIDRKNKNRKLFNIYFLCLPYEVEFDPKLASHLTVWLWVRRGVVEVYVRNSGRKGGKGLDIQEILKREEKWLRENPKRTFVNPTIHPEYCGRIAFSKLSKTNEKRYDKLVEEKKAAGAVTDDEKEKYGEYKAKSPEELIKESIENIRKGKIQDKKRLWESMDELDIDDTQKLKKLNFYLQIEGFPTFSKLFKDKEIMEKTDIFG